MDRILIILKKENGTRASSAPTLGLNTIIFKHVYWYMQQISGKRLQDHWSSGFLYIFQNLHENARRNLLDSYLLFLFQNQITTSEVDKSKAKSEHMTEPSKVSKTSML